MNDSSLFFALVIVVALGNFQTSMTLRRECRKGTEAIIKHIDERSSAFLQNMGSLTSKNSFVNEYSQSDGFIMIGDYASGDAVLSEFRNELPKLGRKLGENQIEPFLPIFESFPLDSGSYSFCGAESYATVNNGTNQVPYRSGNRANQVDDIFHNKSRTKCLSKDYMQEKGVQEK